YTVYSYSNEPPLHTYNTDESNYTDGLFDEAFLKDIEDNNNCTDCENNNESEGSIINENINAYAPPKIIKGCFNKQKIPYGEIVYLVYEKALDLMSEEFKKEKTSNSFDVECNMGQNPIQDDKLQFGEIVYVADKETTDLISQEYARGNKKQENEKLEINMNPLVNKDLDNGNCKERDSAMDLSKSDAKSSNKKEKTKNKDDKDNGADLYNIVGVVVLVVLNM
ncbi:hypothetical protein H311_00746, partial [Anncaliia algerae PRA109]